MLRADSVVVLKGVAKPSGTTRRFSLALGTLGARGRGLGTIPARGAHEGSWEVAERSQFNDDAPREDPPFCPPGIVSGMACERARNWLFGVSSDGHTVLCLEPTWVDVVGEELRV